MKPTYQKNNKQTAQSKEENNTEKETKKKTEGKKMKKPQQREKDAVADVRKLEQQLTEYQEKADALQASLDEVNERFLRLFSEFDNYRKRITKERIELSKTAAEEIITALLPVLDDLERAAEMAKEKPGADQNGEEGLVLIYNKFKSILRQKGVEEIPAEGEEFNTDYHEAITNIPADNKKQKGEVVEEVQKGYLLNGKVIRFARVVVAN